MSGERQVIDRIPPRQQTEWDIRGALNFMLGGAGGGLLAAAALATPLGADMRALEALGLVLVAGGLLAVLAKIGRPLRALYVYRSLSSWMTREAIIAAILFVCGAVAVLLNYRAAFFVCGILGVVYAYAQGRILKANIGIPAWRRWSCVVLIVVTALTEGVGFVCIAMPVVPELQPFAYLLVALIAIRAVVWRWYRDDLRKVGAPTGALAALDAIERPFTGAGHALAGALALAAAAANLPLLAAVGGALALAAGAWLKFTLVCRAAFTQGFALPRTPSRGKGKSGQGMQPGWRQGQNS